MVVETLICTFAAFANRTAATELPRLDARNDQEVVSHGGGRIAIAAEQLIIEEAYPATWTPVLYEPSAVWSKLDALFAELDGYFALDNGWDGASSTKAEEGDISAAKGFLKALPTGFPLPKPMLSSSGAVGLYWSRGENYADLEIEGQGMYSLFLHFADGTESFYDGLSVGGSIEKVRPALNKSS